MQIVTYLSDLYLIFFTEQINILPNVSLTMCSSCISVLFAECGLYPADVVFVLDSSGSVGSTHFNTQLNFVTTFINALDVSAETTATHFGVVTYGSSVYQSIKLNDYVDKTRLINAVLALS